MGRATHTNTTAADGPHLEAFVLAPEAVLGAARLLTVDEVAAFLSVSRRRLYAILDDPGDGPRLRFAKIGASIRIAPADLASYVNACRAESEAWR